MQLLKPSRSVTFIDRERRGADRPRRRLLSCLRQGRVKVGVPARGIPAVLPWERLALGLLLAEVVVLLSQVRVGFSKPFWFDEQWRAYHMSLTGTAFWQQLEQTNAPIAGGWILLEKGAALLFGNVEWALRLPVALSFPLAVILAWRVGRRLLGGLAGMLVAAALAVNGPLFAYVPQLKPFVVEAMATMAVLLLWLWAADPGRGLPRRVAAYAAIGLLAVLATAVLFVIVPLLALDLAGLVPQRRSPRELARRLLPGALAGALVLAHLVWFVLPQSSQTAGSYWSASFVPHGTAAHAWRFARAQLAGFVPEVVTGPLRPSAALGWLLCLALLAGTAVAVLVERRLLVLPVTLFGALALQYLAATCGQWPFGFVRVNLFLVPLLYLLAGAGIARPLRLLGAFACSRLRGGGDKGRRWPWVAQAAGAVVLPLVLVAAVVAAGWRIVPDGLEQVRVARRHTTAPSWGGGIRTLVQQARELQVPGSLAVVGGAMGVKGWAYYMWFYDGWTPDLRDQPPIGPARTLLLTGPDRRAMAAFLAAHRSAKQVAVLYMSGIGPNLAGAIDAPLLRAGYRPLMQRSVCCTGNLDLWVNKRPASTTPPGSRSTGRGG